MPLAAGTAPEFGERLVDRANYAARVVRTFRARSNAFLDDPRAIDLVDGLRRRSPQFRALWDEHDVRRADTDTLEADLPGGRAVMTLVTLQGIAAPGVRFNATCRPTRQAPRCSRTRIPDQAKNALIARARAARERHLLSGCPTSAAVLHVLSARLESFDPGGHPTGRPGSDGAEVRQARTRFAVVAASGTEVGR